MAAALLSAMISFGMDRSSPAWKELGDVVRTTGGRDPELTRQWHEAQVAADPFVVLPLLARALARSAAEDAQLGNALLNWLSRYASQGERGNTISGSLTFHGPTVQAGEIRGGIHFHPPAQRPAAHPTPRQLPPARAFFVDRIEDLETLNELRAEHPDSAVQLVVVSGFAGVGKTALVSRWLQERAADFPDGLLYADLGGYAAAEPIAPGEVLEQFLRAIGAAQVPTETSERTALWRSLTADARLAVMVDNALTAAHVRPLLPAGGGSLVVVTSRGHLTGLLADGAALHRLQPLTADASVALLSRGGDDPRVTADPQAARKVAALCARLPLALCLAAAQLAVHPQQSLSALAATLSQGHGPLDALQADGEAAVRSALDESYRLLPSPVAAVYRCLGLLPSPVYDRHMVAAATGLPLDRAGHALDALLDSNLLEETAPGGYRFHDLVEPHARERGTADESSHQQEEVARRFVTWCLVTATAAEATLTPSHRILARDCTTQHPGPPPGLDDAPTALAWLDTHRAALEAAVRHSAEQGWHSLCWQLVDAQWPVFLRLRPADWWIEAHHIGLDAARAARDRRAENRMLTSGGAGLRNAGRHDEAAAWYARALRHAEEDGDLREQAQALNGLGNAHLARGELADAETHFTRALALREEIGYRRGAALSRLGLGQTALARGDHPAAADRLRRARTELVEAGDSYDAARALAFLGRTLAEEGDHQGAERRLRRAHEEFRTTGSEHWQARTLEMLGDAARGRGATDEARHCYREAAERYRKLSPRDAGRLAERLREM